MTGAKGEPGSLTHLAGNVYAFSPITLWVNEFRGFQLRLILDAHKDGYQCREVTIERNQELNSGPITGEALRAIPVAQLAQTESFMYLEYMLVRDDGALVMVGQWVPGYQRPSEDTDMWPRADPDNALRLVALHHSLAAAAGIPPVREVEIAFGVSRATANRMVSMARSKGFYDEYTGPVDDEVGIMPVDDAGRWLRKTSGP